MNWSQQHPQLKVPAGLEASQHALTIPAGKKPKPALANLGKNGVFLVSLPSLAVPLVSICHHLCLQVSIFLCIDALGGPTWLRFSIWEIISTNTNWTLAQIECDQKGQKLKRNFAIDQVK